MKSPISFGRWRDAGGKARVRGKCGTQPRPCRLVRATCTYRYYLPGASTWPRSWVWVSINGGLCSCASISASTCIARSIHCTSDRITTHTQCILCTRHSSSSFADSPQASEHEHESPQWAATAARQRTQVAAPGRLTQRARLTWETPRPHCPLLTVYTCTHLNTHREPRRGCSVAPHTGFSPAHTHAGGACYLVTLLATTR